MSKLVRLPAVIPVDEIRVWCEPSAWGKNDLRVQAPGSLQQYALAILGAERFGIRDDMDFATRLSLEERYLKRGRSPLEELDAAGFDPATLVLSIRRKGGTAPENVVTDDLRSRLEAAEATLSTLVTAIENIEETKSVYVLDERERDALVEAASEASNAVSSALEMATVGEHIEEVDALGDTDAHVADSATQPPRLTLGDFDKAAVLRWEEQDEDGDYLHLMDKERMVGEVYETDAGNWRWRCVTSDFRSTEGTEREAKDALVLSHCQYLANGARELLREQVALVNAATPAP